MGRKLGKTGHRDLSVTARIQAQTSLLPLHRMAWPRMGVQKMVAAKLVGPRALALAHPPRAGHTSPPALAGPGLPCSAHTSLPTFTFRLPSAPLVRASPLHLSFVLSTSLNRTRCWTDPATGTRASCSAHLTLACAFRMVFCHFPHLGPPVRITLPSSVPG